jgi:hypothetical protein
MCRSEIIDSELAARLLVNFSSDVEADDWHPRISPKKIIALAVSRLIARNKGILLLHAQEATLSALTLSLTAVGHAARARSLNDLMYSAQGLAAANTANCNPG